jgi:hypothetical protein
MWTQAQNNDAAAIIVQGQWRRDTANAEENGVSLSSNGLRTTATNLEDGAIVQINYNSSNWFDVTFTTDGIWTFYMINYSTNVWTPITVFGNAGQSFRTPVGVQAIAIYGNSEHHSHIVGDGSEWVQAPEIDWTEFDGTPPEGRPDAPGTEPTPPTGKVDPGEAPESPDAVNPPSWGGGTIPNEGTPPTPPGPELPDNDFERDGFDGEAPTLITIEDVPPPLSHSPNLNLPDLPKVDLELDISELGTPVLPNDVDITEPSGGEPSGGGPGPGGGEPTPPGETVLNEPPVPLSDQPADDDDEIYIFDEEVPLAYIPEDYITITEMPVPLSGMPQTGLAEMMDVMTTGLVLASLLAACVGTAIRRMKTEKQEDE